MKNPKKPKRGRPINEALREDIICVAGQLFGEKGFYETKMEHIAKELQISKLSLYSRFEGKEDLFQAVIQSKCESYMPGTFFEELGSVELNEALYRVACGLMALLTSESVTKMERMLAGADSQHREALLQLFYKSGPVRFKAKLADFFAKRHVEKQLVVSNPARSADIFAALVKGSDICMRAQMSLLPVATQTEKEAYCRDIVAVFIAGHTPIPKYRPLIGDCILERL